MAVLNMSLAEIRDPAAFEAYLQAAWAACDITIRLSETPDPGP